MSASARRPRRATRPGADRVPGLPRTEGSMMRPACLAIALLMSASAGSAGAQAAKTGDVPVSANVDGVCRLGPPSRPSVNFGDIAAHPGGRIGRHRAGGQAHRSHPRSVRLQRAVRREADGRQLSRPDHHHIGPGSNRRAGRRMTMKFVSLGLTALLAAASGAASAQSSSGLPTPFSVIGNVPVLCTAGTLTEDNGVFAVGVLVDLSTGLLRHDLSAPPKVLHGTFCTSRSTITIEAT